MKALANTSKYELVKKACPKSFALGQSLLILLTLVITSTTVSRASGTLTHHAATAGSGNVLRVGPGETYSRVSDAAAAAQDGDTIEIRAGLYSGAAAAAVLRANGLTVRGVGGGRAHLEAGGVAVQDKGTWVITGNNVTVENIEFSGASVPDQNGAGIRAEGAGLTIRNCYFHNNEDGILTNANPESDLVIEYSEFAYNGFGDGQSHNMYIGRIRSFTLRGCYVHHAIVGHNVKTRSQKNLITYNRIMDEQDGTASYAVNMPNGGDCFLIGNLIEKGPNASNNSSIMTFADEGAVNTVQQLRLVNNTIVNDLGRSVRLVRVAGSPSAVALMNNLLVGDITLPTGRGIVNKANLLSQDPGFVDRAAYDYHLLPSSPAIDRGVAPGVANGVSLTPSMQYVHPGGTEERTLIGMAWDIGAYETGDAP